MLSVDAIDLALGGPAYHVIKADRPDDSVVTLGPVAISNISDKQKAEDKFPTFVRRCLLEGMSTYSSPIIRSHTGFRRAKMLYGRLAGLGVKWAALSVAADGAMDAAFI